MFEPSWLQPSYDEIHNACVDAASLIHIYDFKFQRILGISRGGMLPAMILSHLLDLPVTPVTYSSKQGKGDDKNHENTLPEIKEEFLLVVDDICDSGNTLYEIAQHYENKNAFVYTFALFYKDKPTPIIIPDFRWRTIPEDAGWVIFPYEKKERMETKRDLAQRALGMDL